MSFSRLKPMFPIKPNYGLLIRQWEYVFKFLVQAHKLVKKSKNVDSPRRLFDRCLQINFLVLGKIAETLSKPRDFESKARPCDPVQTTTWVSESFPCQQLRRLDAYVDWLLVTEKKWIEQSFRNYSVCIGDCWVGKEIQAKLRTTTLEKNTLAIRMLDWSLYKLCKDSLNKWWIQRNLRSFYINHQAANATGIDRNTRSNLSFSSSIPVRIHVPSNLCYSDRALFNLISNYKDRNVAQHKYFQCIKKILQRGGANSQHTLIQQLNPIIEAWRAFCNEKEGWLALKRCDKLFKRSLRLWALKKHKNHTIAWIQRRYWNYFGFQNCFSAFYNYQIKSSIISHLD